MQAFIIQGGRLLERSSFPHIIVDSRKKNVFFVFARIFSLLVIFGESDVYRVTFAVLHVFRTHFPPKNRFSAKKSKISHFFFVRVISQKKYFFTKKKWGANLKTVIVSVILIALLQYTHIIFNLHDV